MALPGERFPTEGFMPTNLSAKTCPRPVTVVKPYGPTAWPVIRKNRPVK